MITRKTESERILFPEKSAPIISAHKTTEVISRRKNTFALEASALDMMEASMGKKVNVLIELNQLNKRGRLMRKHHFMNLIKKRQRTTWNVASSRAPKPLGIEQDP